MVKTKAKINGVHLWFREDDLPDTVQIEFIEPPQPNWYGFTTHIDIAQIQRVYHDLMLAEDSPEFDYFLKSVLYKIERDVRALMRLGGVMR